MERRLAALLAADMVGFSRRMQADEEGTFNALKTVIADKVDPAIAAHQGRVFKNTGDGFFAEFGSAVDALNTAIAIQVSLVQQDSPDPVQFRMGLNIGDVMVEDGDLIGDAVNIAARLEPLAPTGGIVVSETMRTQLWNKTEARFDSIGPQELKNIVEPVTVYRILSDKLPDTGALEQRAEPQPRPMLTILPFVMIGNNEDAHIAE